MTQSNNSLLGIVLSAAVPLHIIENYERFNLDDAAFQAAFEKAQAFGKTLGEKGDVLLFGSKKSGEAAQLFNEFAAAVAMLAYCPGGVTLFGQQYEVEDVLAGFIGKEAAAAHMANIRTPRPAPEAPDSVSDATEVIR